MASSNTRTITINIAGNPQGGVKAMGEIEDAAKGLGDKMKDFGTKILEGFGFGGGFAAGEKLGEFVLDGFGESMSAESLNDKLAAQLALTPQQAESFGRAAGDLYAGAYGDSLEQVNEALANVQKNIGEGIGPADDALKTVTAKALDLVSIFDQDLPATTAAAGQLIKTGLVADADEAFDVLTRGFQTGANKADDLLDTLNEYPTQFRDLGLTGAQAVGLLNQGLTAGARDADIVADALKEFAIRAKDGSETTAEGFKAIGLSANQMAQTFARGGPQAAAALDTVLDRVRAIEDPVKRSQVAIALFGTQAEDLQQSLFALDPSEAVASLGEISGAADKMGATFADNAATKIEEFKRQAMVKLTEFMADKVIPTFERIGEILTNDFGPAVQATTGFLSDNKGAVIAATAALGVLFLVTKAHALFLAVEAAGGLAKYITQINIVTAATKAWAAVQWVLNAAMAANPVVLVTIALIALGAALVLAWQHSETFREIVTGAFDKVKGAVMGAFNWVKDNWPLLLTILTGPIGLAVLAITRNWESIKSGIGSVIDFVKGIPGKIASAASGMFDGIKDAFKSAINWIIRAWNGLEFKVPGVKVPGLGTVGGFTLGVPDIPLLANGALISSPTLAMIGESPRTTPEIVSPVATLRQVYREEAGRGGMTVIIQQAISPGADKGRAGREVVEAIKAYELSSGRKVLVTSQ